MELLEISDILDIKLNSFEQKIHVDEYEKSLYLTAAQTKVFDELIRAFEVNGDLSKDLEPFIKEATLTTSVSRTGTIANSIFFEMPTDLRKPVYEAAVLSSLSDPIVNGKEVKIIYTKAAELSRKIKNPFRVPNYEEIFRVITFDEINGGTRTPAAELVPPSGASVSAYKLKYISKCTPIVLEDLPGSLEIEGVSTATNSKFNTEKLDKIIDLAIALILKDKIGTKSEV